MNSLLLLRQSGRSCKEYIPLMLQFFIEKEKHQSIWSNVDWTDKSKIKDRHVWYKIKTAFQWNNLIPAVKHEGGNFMVWGYLERLEACSQVSYASCLRMLKDNEGPSA